MYKRQALNTDEEKADDESNQLSAEAKKDLIRNEYHNQKKKTDKTKIFIIVAAVIVVIAAAVGLGFATGPVSYTHLDVYKRQREG